MNPPFTPIQSSYNYLNETKPILSSLLPTNYSEMKNEIIPVLPSSLPSYNYNEPKQTTITIPFMTTPSKTRSEIPAKLNSISNT